MTNSDFIEQTRLLVACTQRGDHKSFTQLYNTYVNQFSGFGSRLTTGRELLEDYIHGVLVKIYVKREELNEIVSFRSYLFISPKNQICDELHRLVFGSDVQADNPQRMAEDADVEEDYLCHEAELSQSVKVESLLRQFFKRQRQTITLYYMEEKKYEDICVTMDVNYQFIRNLVCRSLNRLHELATAVRSRYIVRPVISFLQPHSSPFYTVNPVQPIPAQSTFRRGVIQYTIEWHPVCGSIRKGMWLHSMSKVISPTIKQ